VDQPPSKAAAWLKKPDEGKSKIEGERASRNRKENAQPPNESGVPMRKGEDEPWYVLVPTLDRERES